MILVGVSTLAALKTIQTFYDLATLLVEHDFMLTYSLP